MNAISFENIPYQSFCWVLGTTTFRRAQLNLVTEQQLVMLSEFRNKQVSAGIEWKWTGNRELQAKFYDFVHSQNDSVGSAKMKDKDARQQTSPLTTLGFTNDERIITEAGQELVKLAEKGNFNSSNPLLIAADSLIYLKQLLKTSLSANNDQVVRPYLVLAHLLNELEWMSYDEFGYLLPMVNDGRSLEIISAGIRDLRNGKTTIDEIIVKRLKAMPNVRQALELFLAHPVTSDLFMAVGMNRKSRSYDKVYFSVFLAAQAVFQSNNPGKEELVALDRATKKLNSNIRNSWRKIFFNGKSTTEIKKLGLRVIPTDCPLWGHKDNQSFKAAFFWQMHLFKSRATLKDYSDLNRRYFKLTDTILFKDDTVTFDILPKAFFKITKDALMRDMFVKSKVLTKPVNLSEIAPEFSVSNMELRTALSQEYHVEFADIESANVFVRNERYSRLHHLLDTRFTQRVLSELLECFITRDDQRIAEVVTDSATPSTILEYVLGLCWYEISGRVGDVLDYMKLQLEADLLPRTHAQGGGADIVYEYEKSGSYVEHALLIEATLADGTNMRQMEMEPVSRHLGRQIINSKNRNDYCVFIAPHLDLNVINDFRYRKSMGFIDNASQEKIPLKIIPLEIRQIKKLLDTGAHYKEIFQGLQKVFESDEMDPKDWMIQIENQVEALAKLHVSPEQMSV